MPPGASTHDRPDARGRPRRALVTIFLVLGAVAALACSFALWVDRQALSPDGWQSTSSRLIASRQIRQGVGTFAVDQLLARTSVAAAVRSALPSVLADPALQTLRSVGLRLATGILASQQARIVWDAANRQAHRDLLEILDHGGGPREVTLNLRPLLADLIAAFGASASVKAILGGGELLGRGSSAAGSVRILRADQVNKVRSAVNAVRGLSVALLVAAALLFGAAVAGASGWRSIAVRRVGYCLIVVGVVVLAARALLAPALADGLVSASAYRQVADAAWMISTTELRDIAVATLVGGGVLALAGLLTAVAGARSG